MSLVEVAGHLQDRVDHRIDRLELSVLRRKRDANDRHVEVVESDDLTVDEDGEFSLVPVDLYDSGGLSMRSVFDLLNQVNPGDVEEMDIFGEVDEGVSGEVVISEEMMAEASEYLGTGFVLVPERRNFISV